MWRHCGPPIYVARRVIGFASAAPDLVWALLFVTAVELGYFPGALTLSVHSIGMLGRLFAETIEHLDMAPIDALTLTAASGSHSTGSTKTSARHARSALSLPVASAGEPLPGMSLFRACRLPPTAI